MIFLGKDGDERRPLTQHKGLVLVNNSGEAARD